MRLLLAHLMTMLPHRLRVLIARRILGWDIHPTARLGRSVIRVGHVTMGAGSSIGPRNTIRGLERLELGEGAIIDSRNMIICFPLWMEVFPDSPDRDPSLVLDRFAMVTTAHEIDCSDRVSLGEHAVLAGFGCQVLTHSLNLMTDRQGTSPTHIGERSAVMTGCILLSGCGLPARSILSAGSVVTTKLSAELTFYRGNPAEAVRTLPDRLKFYHRGDRPGPQG